MPEITVADTPPRVQYVADGQQTEFTFPFPILAAADLVVVFDDGAMPGAHGIAGVGVSAGGTVAFASAPPAGTRITIYRDQPVARTADFVEAGAFRATALNAELDRLAMMVQQVEATAADALRRAPHDGAAELTLPPLAQRADTVLGFDAQGRPQALPDPAIAAQEATARAGAAADSADEAAGSATTATDAAATASDAGTAASASAAAAQRWAEEAEDVEVAPGEFSAHHWASKAAANAVDLPRERRRGDLAAQRVRWSLAVPGVAVAPAWAVDFLFGLGLDALTVSRDGPATFHDDRGRLVTAGPDEPRLDHDPATGAPRGLLVEAARTNLLHDSFAPATQTRNLAAGTYTLSITGGGSCELSGAAAGVASAGSPLTFTLASAADVTFTVGGSPTTFQCEAGSVATSPIETPAGGSATRAADIVTAADLGWLNPDAVSFVVAARLADVPGDDAARLLTLDDGGDPNRHNLYYNGISGRMSLFTKSSGASQGSVSAITGGWTDGAVHGLGFAVGGGSRSLFADGAKANADSVADPAGFSTLRLGAYHGGQQWNGHIRRVAAWNARLSDADLVALTG